MEPPTGLRTDERRALALLADGRWLEGHHLRGRQRRAGVRLSKYRGDEIPVGWDVLERLRAAGFLVPGRRLPGGAERFYLTGAGRAVLDATAGVPG